MCPVITDREWYDVSGCETVVAFSGHMIDAPTRPVLRFVTTSEAVVATAIREQLRACNARAAVTGLASGSDIIFAEAAVELGLELHVVLPVNIEAFLEESVRISGDVQWEARFNAVRKSAELEEVFGDDYLRGSGAPFQMQALLIDGKAQRIAREQGRRPVTLCVWDGQPGDGLGGTASAVGHAVKQGRVVRAIHPHTGEVSTPPPEAASMAQRDEWLTKRVGTLSMRHRLMSFLFADAKGFSEMREGQIPTFARIVLDIFARVLSECLPQPLVVNTWGDGLFVACESPSQCTEIALRLIEEAERVRHDTEGLVPPVGFRIGLHAGPAFFVDRDPITTHPNAYGREVSLAARIEPIANVNEAWASAAYVLFSESFGLRDVRFDSLGEKPLPKASRSLQLFRVSRA